MEINICQRIKDIAEAKNISAKELADHIGMTSRLFTTSTEEKYL